MKNVLIELWWRKLDSVEFGNIPISLRLKIKEIFPYAISSSFVALKSYSENIIYGLKPKKKIQHFFPFEAYKQKRLILIKRRFSYQIWMYKGIVFFYIPSINLCITDKNAINYLVFNAELKIQGFLIEKKSYDNELKEILKKQGYCYNSFYKLKCYSDAFAVYSVNPNISYKNSRSLDEDIVIYELEEQFKGINILRYGERYYISEKGIKKLEEIEERRTACHRIIL